MSTKTASQAGWSLRYTQSSGGSQFVTARSIDADANYCEYSLADNGWIVEYNTNTCGFFDMPLSVCQLIRFWFGTINSVEYSCAMRDLSQNWNE
jgi:hypothetical protein